jgi:hypothetical protein
MAVVTLPLLSNNLQDKPDIYWKITKAPYLNKPQPNLDFSKPVIKYRFKKEVAPIHYINYVVWNVLDVYTTNQGINVGGYAIEANPTLPKRPSLDLLITRKLWLSYYLYRLDAFEDERTLKGINTFGTGIVLSNFYVLHQNGDFL